MIFDPAVTPWRELFEPSDARTVAEYGRDEVKGPSAISRSFSPEATPWNVEPMNDCHVGSPVRRIVQIKPIQAGGSRGGEVALCYWLDEVPSGTIAYFWPTNEKASTRWDTDFCRLLKASSVSNRLPIGDKTQFKTGTILLPHLNFQMMGVESKDNTSSGSIQWAVMEEVHLWGEGKLQLALGRLTAYQTKNHRVFIISNASNFEDQLHRAFLDGTQQHWEVLCPGCQKMHPMRTRWNDQRPDLGGLRYDADGCRLEGGYYNYTKLAETIRYQFPCGFTQRDVISERTRLSRSGRYSAPTNAGASLFDRSYILEAVAIHHISWLQLIKDKHSANRALNNGNLGPFSDYVKERECGFFNPKELPGSQRIELRSSAPTKPTPDSPLPDWISWVKIYDGNGTLIPARFMFIDKQRGRASRNEAPHFWAVIRDFGVIDGGRLKSSLVFEGKIQTESDVEDVRETYGVPVANVGIDSGDETQAVYRQCAHFGYLAFKGDGDESKNPKSYRHRFENGTCVRRIFSEKTDTDPWVGTVGGGNYTCELIRFCKKSIRERLVWAMAGGMDFEIPSNASADYIAHHSNEQFNEIKGVWEDFGRRIDLKVCDLGVLLLAEMAGLVGGSVDDLKIRKDENPDESK